MSLETGHSIVIIDTETTGLGPEYEILQFSGIRATPSTVHALDFKLQMRACAKFTPEALRINGYDPERAKTLPFMESKIDEIKLFCKANVGVVVGHNIDFDIAMLNGEIVRYGGRPLRSRRIDTMTLAHTLLSPRGLSSLSLKEVCKTLGVRNESEHSSLGDVKATALCYVKMMEMVWGKRGLAQAFPQLVRLSEFLQSNPKNATAP